MPSIVASVDIGTTGTSSRPIAYDIRGNRVVEFFVPLWGSMDNLIDLEDDDGFSLSKGLLCSSPG